jgi:hypothetical protein
VERHPLDSCDDHLGNPHAPLHLKTVGTEIHQCHHQLAAVIAVYRCRRIRQGYPMFQCQTGPGPQLALISIGDRNAEAGPEELSFEGRQLAVLGAGQVVPG